MFDKKEMKKIKMNRVSEHMMNGEAVYMVMSDGSLVEIGASSDMRSIICHSIMGGTFAVYRKKFEIGGFTKQIKIGDWTITIGHEKRGGEEENEQLR